MTTTISKNRIRINKIKLLVAASSLILIRRAVYVMTIVSLPISLLSSIHISLAKPKEAITSVDSFGANGSEHHNISSLALNASVSAGTYKFSDVPAGHWAEESIMEAVFTGYITGYEDGTFRPDQLINVTEFAAALTRGLNIPLAAAPMDPTSPTGYFETLRDVGILKEDDFKAGEREHYLLRSTMIMLALRALDSEQPAVDDKPLAKQAAAAGLLDGEQAILGQKPATRAEVTIVLQRLRKALCISGGAKQVTF